MAEVFPNDFADSLPEDTVLACATICEAVLAFNRHRTLEVGMSSYIEDQNAYLDALAMFQVYTEAHPLDISYELPDLGTDSEENSRKIINFFELLNSELNKLVVKQKLSGFRQNYALKFGQANYYQFDEYERTRIQKLIHELRVLIEDVGGLTEYQKSSLLTRFGKIHGSLHHKHTDLDLIWGLLGEALVVQARHGIAGRLIVDRLYDILRVAWHTQARSESVDVKKADPKPAVGIPSPVVEIRRRR